MFFKLLGPKKVQFKIKKILISDGTLGFIIRKRVGWFKWITMDYNDHGLINTYRGIQGWIGGYTDAKKVLLDLDYRYNQPYIVKAVDVKEDD